MSAIVLFVGDGWVPASVGDATVDVMACDTPSGYVDDDTDCDDDDGDVNPSGTEVPQDGIDQDCDGSDAPYAVTDLGVADLLITEVMQNPDAVVDSAGEWFEVYNNSGGEVELDGLTVYDLGSNTFTVSGTLLVAAEDYVVFGNNDDTSTNGGVTVDYEFSGSAMALGNADDELYLSESTSHTTVFDAVEWDGGPDFPDPTGASMSLNPAAFDEADNDDGANWCEASSAYGDGDLGTPGADNDSCSYNIGNDTVFSGSSIHAANYLLGQQITITSDVTLDQFGVIVASGTPTATFALYSDSSGAPGSLVAQTSSTGLSSGVNEIDITDVSLSAGTYWIMAVYSSTAYIGENTSGSVTTAYVALTYGSSLPDPYVGSGTYADGEFNYYLVVY